MTAPSISSSMPATPFLNSVTLLPSDRITLGSRLPKISSAMQPMISSSLHAGHTDEGERHGEAPWSGLVESSGVGRRSI